MGWREATANSHPDGIVAWLESFADNVRTSNFSAAQKLFSEESFGFGTRAAAYENLADLRQNQWEQVWPNTAGFHFKLDTLRTILDAANTVCCVACQWESTGIRQDGSQFPRSGRSTILLQRRSGESSWICLHTHFSMTPS